MKLISLRLVALFFIAVMFAGCLTVDKKEYSYKLNSDGSGEGWIKFYNIQSSSSDEEDATLKDFAELIDDYVKGSKFEEDNPALQVTSKEVFEEGGKLNALVKFKFSDISNINFLYDAKCKCAPIYYSMAGSFSESYESSNGEYLGETKSIQVIKWPGDTKEFKFTTTVNSDEKATSLLNQYKAWKADQK